MVKRRGNIVPLRWAENSPVLALKTKGGETKGIKHLLLTTARLGGNYLERPRAAIKS